ncbi:MAG: hypothetical protein RL701_3001 [Pseudomonadota bacterium]
MQENSEVSNRRVGRILAFVFGAVFLFVIGFGVWNRRNLAHVARNWDDLSDGSPIARELRNTPNMLEYIVTHAEDISLVSYRIGDEEHGIFLNADRPRPLASTVKLLALADYAAAVESGELRPDEPVALADWEKYFLPKTDGDAHALTLEQLRTSKAITGDKVQLQDLVYGMIRYSDNAATDYLLARLGRTRLAAAAVRLELGPSEQVPLPLSGLFLSWESTRSTGSPADRLARYRAQPYAQYADDVWTLAATLRSDAQFGSAERERLVSGDGSALTLREQAQFARTLSPKGTARSYARLMAKIAQGELPGSAAMQAELQWPMRAPQLRENFDAFGTKGGSLPSIVTEAIFATPKGTQQKRVCALFFEGMPMAVWLELMHSFMQQRFEQELLSSDEFFEHVRDRVSNLPKR